MSGEGRPDLAALDVGRLSIGVAAARWHEQAMAGLLGGAERALTEAAVRSSVVVRAPGCFELPLLCKALARQGFDAVVALGVVVRGGTPHFEYVCRAVTDGLTRVALDAGVPVGFGVLTCDTNEQALARAGLAGSSEDKGYDAVHAALSMAVTLQTLPAPQPSSVSLPGS